MGPNIVLDKSSLQAIRQRDIYTLSRHLSFVLCPVLLIEILGDLKKGQINDGLSTDEVRILADKLLSGGYPCANYRYLMQADLFGESIPVTGQVPRAGARSVKTAKGTAMVFDVSAENRAILRWQRGEFSEAEQELSTQWRESTAALDLEAFQRRYRKRVRRFKCIENLVRYVTFVSNPSTAESRRVVLDAVFDEFGVPPAGRAEVMKRWIGAGSPCLVEFAPYTFHCFRVNLVFKLGVITGLIGTRKSNTIDMQYFYYTPFCNVFSSRDALHAEMAPYFLRDDQMFIPGDDLIRDLKNISTWWDGLSDGEQRERDSTHGSRPPEDPSSPIHKAWTRYCVPWTPGSGNRASKMTTEEDKAILDEMNELMRLTKRDGGDSDA